jgi:hypothetical protein
MSVPPDQTQEQPAPARRPRAGRTVWIVLAAVAAVLLVAALVAVGARLSGDGDGDRDRDAGPDDRQHTVSGPLDGREQATLVLLDGAATVTMNATDIGDRLYRVEAPEDGALVPAVTAGGDEVRVELADTDDAGPSAVDIQLSSAVRWRVRILGGTTDLAINLAQARVSGVELGGGAASIDLTLPPPEGTMSVRMTGGVGQWSVHQVGDAPVRVRVGGGAGSVTIDGDQESGVSGGTVVAPPDWDDTEDRVDIDAVAGMSVFDLDRR